MFDHHELQTLISGAMIPVNIQDLKQHTHYSGGYTINHPVIQNFWDVVENFTDTQKRQLLKFVTSCSRPPLLGFKDLFPAFCVHFGGNEEDRLPTASTCMNLLKLPEFHDKETLRTKLTYAIESGAGFELSWFSGFHHAHTQTSFVLTILMSLSWLLNRFKFKKSFSVISFSCYSPWNHFLLQIHVHVVGFV